MSQVFELLTLQQPFEATSLAALVGAIQRGLSPQAAAIIDTIDAPAALKRLATSECLLHADPKLRMTPDEVLQLFPRYSDAPKTEAQT